MNTNRPAIPEKVRTVAYFVLLVASAVSLAVQGLADVWAAQVLAERISDSAEVITSVLAVLAGGLGVTYRPTRKDLTNEQL